ncbi:J domain-containing protein [Halocatena marina]|uniref:J domain-containing protein n=1 Tax=Halocatena marina TaxID=2934937 RepID=A0ABD5YQ09_9EURY
MDRNRLILSIAAVFAGLAALLVVVGIVYEPFVFLVAFLFGIVAYLMWYQASGRLSRRVYRRVEELGRANNGQNERSRGGFGAGPREDWQPRSEWARRAGFSTQRQRQTHNGQHGEGRRTRQTGQPSSSSPTMPTRRRRTTFSTSIQVRTNQRSSAPTERR